MFDAWCQQRGSYEGSAWFKSWGVAAAHPEFLVIDRDGHVRDHHYAWSEAGMIACQPLVQQMCGF